MSAFLKIDECKTCQRAIPWEWVPAVLVRGSPLAGTGVWRSQLVDDRCPACTARLAEEQLNEQRRLQLRLKLIELLGGEKPYREFIFDRFVVTPGNRVGYERCREFNPACDSLYLWGACGVGKTHLAYAAVRRCLEEGLTVEIVTAYTLSRKVRMKEPDRQQTVIDQLVRAEVLLLDDLGAGSETLYNQQLLQEILDERDFHGRSGMLVTSSYPLDGLASKMGNDAIPSRIAGFCSVIGLKGPDYRLAKNPVQPSY